MTHPLASRPAITLYTLAALIAAPYALPSGTSIASRLRVLTPREEPRRAPEPEPAPSSSVVGEVAVGATSDNRLESAGDTAPKTDWFGGAATPIPALDAPPPRSIEDPSGHALDAFFRSLAKTEAKAPRAITRILYYGDSVIASDWITSTLRRKMQARFGDAGHGFVLVADAWPGYHHDGVARYASKGWKVSRVVGPYASDGLYGLGGVSFVADGPGMYAEVATAKSGEIGRAVSHFRVAYAEQPNGGTLSLKLDDERPILIPTAGEATRTRVADVDAPDGAHKLEIRSNGGGPVRVFHAILERDGPGVVVDAIGIIGCRLRFLDQMDDADWAEELRRREPALVAFTYGANESGDGFAYPIDQYEITARAVLKQVRDAVPDASCLLVSPMDAADKKGDGYVTRPVIPAIVGVQRKLAAELGCAFFDTFSAMGGHGSMGTWIQRGLGGHDLVHPTSTGAELIGNWVYRALMEKYDAFRREPSPAPSAPSP